MLGAASTIVIIILFFIHLYIQGLIDQKKQDNTYLNQQNAILDSKIGQIKGLQDEKNQLINRTKVVQALQADRPSIVKLLDGIARLVPKNLYLTKINKTGKVIKIDGVAETYARISEYMANVAEFSWLKNPVLNNSQSKSDESRDSKSQESGISFSMQLMQESMEEGG